MYICQDCGKNSQLGEKSYPVVVETREHKFPFRSKVHRLVRDGKVEWHDDPGGVGQQIVKEIRVCRDCKTRRAA